MTTRPLQTLRDVIATAFPELGNAPMALRTEGWDCVAVDVDDRVIFKFPRDRSGADALAREARLLAAVRPVLTLPVPYLVFHPGPPPFSRHDKLAGEHLVTAQYEALSEPSRQRLAGDMALFFAELHALDHDEIAAVGARPIEPWQDPDTMLAKALPALPDALRPAAEQAIAHWQAMPPDPHGDRYGFFDGHGWNMAFDHARGRLNGIYDFGDSGFGALHREFVYPSLVAPELTMRIVDEYEALTGLHIDRERVDLLSGVFRLSDLAELAHDPVWHRHLVDNATAWLGSRRLRPTRRVPR